MHKISIIPRGVAALGYTMQVPTEDRFLMTEGELENKVATLLGGRAAEELIYDEVSTGAHDDLSKATDIARSMVKTFGMSPRLGQVSFEKDRRALMLQIPIETAARGEYSEQTARAIDDEVRRIIDEQRERVAEILSRRHEILLRAAQVLLAKETITGQELRELLNAEEPASRRAGLGAPTCCSGRGSPPRILNGWRYERSREPIPLAETAAPQAVPIKIATPQRQISDRMAHPP